MARQSPQAQTPFKDYYQILHLHPEADAAMVDQAYWHLARLYNAASASDPSARASLDELNEAYSVLRSPSLRKEYDRVRDVVLGEDAAPLPPPQAEPEPPPLAVMSKQRPKPRAEPDAQPEAPKRQPRRVPRPHIERFSIPPWQGLASAAVIVTLAVAALLTGTQPALVIGLLVIGVIVAVFPVVRSLPRFPELPRAGLHLPSIRAPHLPERPAHPSMDTDTLRRSTEAMRARWRSGQGPQDPAPHDESPFR
jgi:hypothetical protein